MKTIGVLLPCYNEEDNVIPIAEAIMQIFAEQLQNYHYTIVFIDNCSTDSTPEKLRSLCAAHKQVRAILNAKNFQWQSCWWGIINTPGDCVICIPSDFQVPVAVIPKLVEGWEKGHDVVCLIKSSSKENKIMWGIRQLYYKISKMLSEGETLPNFTGGLYDRKFLDVCVKTGDPLMYNSFRSFICTHGYNILKLEYIQDVRKSGRSSNNFSSMVQIALVRLTESSTILPLITFKTGIIMVLVSLALAFLHLLVSALTSGFVRVDSFILLCAMVFIGAVQLIFMGMLGEYLMKINGRLMNRPVVIEKERINF